MSRGVKTFDAAEATVVFTLPLTELGSTSAVFGSTPRDPNPAGEAHALVSLARVDWEAAGHPGVITVVLGKLEPGEYFELIPQNPINREWGPKE